MRVHKHRSISLYNAHDISEDDENEPIGLAAIELGVEDDWYQPVTIDKAVKRETQQESTNRPINGLRQHHYQP